MLSNLPMEIVEEILLNLPLVDLLHMISTNKRLWSIAHGSKTPVRHRLQRRTSVVTFKLNTSCVDLKVDIYDYEKSGAVTSNKYYIFKFVITPNYDLREHTHNLISSSKFEFPHRCYNDEYLATNNENNACYIQCRDSGEAILLACLHLIYLAKYYSRIEEFILLLEDHDLQKLFFDNFKSESISLGRIYLVLDRIKIDSTQFFNAKIFERGIHSIDYQNYYESNMKNTCFALHDKVVKAKEIRKLNWMPSISDKQLSQFENLEILNLNDERNISSDGIVKLIKKVLDRKHSGELKYKIRTKQAISIENITSLIPTIALIKKRQTYAIIRNRFGEVYRVEATKCWFIESTYIFQLQTHRS